MAVIIPILRIFNYDKAVEFYVNWLGFKVDWKYQPENVPLYLQISMGDIILQLSKHHGDGCPGALVSINQFTGLAVYHRQLLAKNYTYNRPGLETPDWDPNTIQVTVSDPFGNRLIFNEVISHL